METTSNHQHETAMTVNQCKSYQYNPTDVSPAVQCDLFRLSLDMSHLKVRPVHNFPLLPYVFSAHAPWEKPSGSMPQRQAAKPWLDWLMVREAQHHDVWGMLKYMQYMHAHCTKTCAYRTSYTYNMNTYDNWGDVSLSSCDAKFKAVGQIRDRARKLELVTCQTALVVEPLP